MDLVNYCPVGQRSGARLVLTSVAAVTSVNLQVKGCLLPAASVRGHRSIGPRVQRRDGRISNLLTCKVTTAKVVTYLEHLVMTEARDAP